MRWWGGRRLAVGLLLWCGALSTLIAAPDAVSAHEPRAGVNAVASAHPLATAAAFEIFAAGGNAFDAAVAISATLAVVEPTGSGLGGGGFWLLHRASDQRQIFVDGRETAPAAAHERMYQDSDGKAIDKASRDGPLAAGIPGEPAALVHLAERYGKLDLARSLAPAIRAARDGFACDDKLAGAFDRHWRRLSAEARRVFAIDGLPPVTGDRILQPELALTLQRLAGNGHAGFYRGEVAQRLVDGSRRDGGIWSLEDLRSYRVVERKPTVSHFRNVRIVSAPPPSAGGITLGATLGQLEALGWREDQGVSGKHLVIEALRRAYRDRAAWLGDPDFVQVPQRRLLSTDHARTLAAGIDPDRATRSADLEPARSPPQGPQTTHFSVLDAQGNRVAATLSVNLPFGSGYMAPGTGVLFNDEMDDFSASLESSNAYGLIGSEPNLIWPHKRPLSSMSPTFAEGPHGVLIVGTPGGSRIITMVLHALLAWAGGADAQAIAALPRYHHQYLPDVVQFEPGAFTAAERQALHEMGHVLRPLDSTYGNLQAITVAADGTVAAASDPRGVGLAHVE